MDLNAFVMCSLNVIIFRTFEYYFKPLMDVQNSLITLIVYDTSKDELLSYVDKQLEVGR